MQRSLFSSIKNHHTTLRNSSGFVFHTVTGHKRLHFFHRLNHTGPSSLLHAKDKVLQCCRNCCCCNQQRTPNTSASRSVPVPPPAFHALCAKPKGDSGGNAISCRLPVDAATTCEVPHAADHDIVGTNEMELQHVAQFSTYLIEA
jgi:hypothetical protein